MTGWKIGACLAAAVLWPAADACAGCLHTGQLWSCTDASGHFIQLYCIGAGVVLSCSDFSGGWILVGPHEVLSQITEDSQVSSALDSRHPSTAPPPSQTLRVAPGPGGVIGISPKPH